jgi:hypothetical protein
VVKPAIGSSPVGVGSQPERSWFSFFKGYNCPDKRRDVLETTLKPQQGNLGKNEMTTAVRKSCRFGQIHEQINGRKSKDVAESNAQPYEQQ